MAAGLIFWNIKQIKSYPAFEFFSWSLTAFRIKSELEPHHDLEGPLWPDLFPPLRPALSHFHLCSSSLPSFLASKLAGACVPLRALAPDGLAACTCTCSSEAGTAHQVTLLHFSLCNGPQSIYYFLKLSCLFIYLMFVLPSVSASWERNLISLTHYCVPSTWQSIWTLTGVP